MNVFEIGYYHNNLMKLMMENEKGHNCFIITEFPEKRVSFVISSSQEFFKSIYWVYDVDKSEMILCPNIKETGLIEVFDFVKTQQEKDKIIIPLSVLSEELRDNDIFMKKAFFPGLAAMNYHICIVNHVLVLMKKEAQKAEKPEEKTEDADSTPKTKKGCWSKWEKDKKIPLMEYRQKGRHMQARLKSGDYVFRARTSCNVTDNFNKETGLAILRERIGEKVRMTAFELKLDALMDRQREEILNFVKGNIL